MSKDKITVNMNIYDIPILVEELEKANKEIERLNNTINKAIELLNDWNYLDKIDCYYEPKEVIDILKGDNK